MFNKISLSLVFGLLAASACAQQIQWCDDFAAARQTAAQQGKLILLHFYRDACPPCERVEKNVFPSAEVADALGRSYVAMKIYGPQAAELVKRYQIEAYPTDVIVNASGLEVFRCISPPDAKNYALMLNGTAAQSGANGAAQAGAYTPGSTANAYAAGLSGAAAANIQAYTNQAQGYVNQAQTQAQDYTNQAQTQANNYANQAQNQINNYAGQAQNYASQYLGQANNAVNGAVGSATDSIAAAATMPSQLPPRRSEYGTAGGYAQVAQAAPQIPTVNGAVSETPQPAQVRDQYGPQYQAQPSPQLAPQLQQQPASGGQYNPAGGQYQPAGGSYPPSTVVNYGQPAPQQPNPGPQYQANPYVNQPPMQQPPAQQAAPPQQRPVQQAAASGPPPLSMDGYCPVFLVEKQKWKKADPRWGAIHRGRTYLFASEEEQKKFLADPDKYSPVLAGFDPVRFAETGELVDGRRSHGLLYESQIFLFADEASLDRFTKAAKRYAGTARQAMAQSDGSVRR